MLMLKNTVFWMQSKNSLPATLNPFKQNLCHTSKMLKNEIVAIFEYIIWANNLMIKSITRSFVMLSVMTENENSSCNNISIPLLRLCPQHSFRYCFHFPSSYSTWWSYWLYRLEFRLQWSVKVERWKSD